MGKYLREFLFEADGQGQLFTMPPPCASPDRAALDRAQATARRRSHARRLSLARRAVEAVREVDLLLLMAICSEPASLGRALQLQERGRLRPADWLWPVPVALARACLGLGARGEAVTGRGLRRELRSQQVLILGIEREAESDGGLLDSLTRLGRDPEVCLNPARLERWARTLAAARPYVDLVPGLLEEQRQAKGRAPELPLFSTAPIASLSSLRDAPLQILAGGGSTLGVPDKEAKMLSFAREARLVLHKSSQTIHRERELA